jgi:hypothetical protein
MTCTFGWADSRLPSVSPQAGSRWIINAASRRVAYLSAVLRRWRDSVQVLPQQVNETLAVAVKLPLGQREHRAAVCAAAVSADGSEKEAAGW